MLKKHNTVFFLIALNALKVSVYFEKTFADATSNYNFALSLLAALMQLINTPVNYENISDIRTYKLNIGIARKSLMTQAHLAPDASNP